jgi:hypothetical protein
MGGLLVLIVFAFAGPEGLLRLQDKSRLTGSVSISNTGTDYTVWKEEYETDTVRRLQNLADGIALGKQYYISEQDYEAATDGEIYSLIDEYILNTEWNYTFQDMGVIPEDYFFKNMDTDHISIKRYILYDEKLSDGVAIMAYDICMRMKEEEVTGVSIECVVDSETGTLYAMKVVLEDETEPVTWDDIGADAPYYFITDYMQSYLTEQFWRFHPVALFHPQPEFLLPDHQNLLPDFHSTNPFRHLPHLIVSSPPSFRSIYLFQDCFYWFYTIYYQFSRYLDAFFQ